MSGRRNLRKRAASEEPEEDEGQESGTVDFWEKLQETKLLQQLRKRTVGLDASTLAGEGRAVSEEPQVRSREQSPALEAGLTDAYVRAKTMLNKVDDDPNMQKFIEEQLALRLGKNRDDDGKNDPVAKQKKLEAELYAVPEVYKTDLDARLNEAALPGAVASLGEAALPAAMRLHNVEQTEAIKRKMLYDLGVNSIVAEEEAERAAAEAKKIKRSQFVPIFGKATLLKQDPIEKEEIAKARKYVVDPSLAGSKKKNKH